MQLLNDYLDLVAKARGVETDKELAVILGVSPQAISVARRRGRASAAVIYRIADILNEDARHITAEIEAETARTVTLRRFWKAQLEKLNTSVYYGNSTVTPHHQRGFFALAA